MYTAKLMYIDRSSNKLGRWHAAKNHFPNSKRTFLALFPGPKTAQSKDTQIVSLTLVFLTKISLVKRSLIYRYFLFPQISIDQLNNHKMLQESFKFY